MITNKSATEQGVMIRVNGEVSHGPSPVQFVTGTDPSLANTASNPKAVSVQTSSFPSSIVVPPYSVLRVDLMTPPVATFFNAASNQTGPAAPAELVTFAGPQSSPGLEPTSVTITDSTGSMSTARLSGSNGTSFVMPARIALGPARVAVMHAGATVLTGALTVTGVAPGIYSANQNGAGVALATAAVGTTGAPMPVYSCQGGIGLSCLSTPIPLSTATGTVYVVLSGTGIRGASSVEAYVAGHRVPVLGFGAEDPDPSLDHVTISLPTGTGLEGLGESSLYIVADGKTSNMTTIYIH